MSSSPRRDVRIQRCVYPAGASGASSLEGGAHGLRLVDFARVCESRETLFVESNFLVYKVYMCTANLLNVKIVVFATVILTENKDKN